MPFVTQLKGKVKIFSGNSTGIENMCNPDAERRPVGKLSDARKISEAMTCLSSSAEQSSRL